MADSKEDETVALLELLVSSLAQVDPCQSCSSTITKGVFNNEEFKAQLAVDRANYIWPC
jgi:hypothetical protein